MKILRIRAENINSLKGKTDIDFEKFLDNSTIFAITGVTGSGKSTILDIISCGLYGQTPRLRNPSDLISKDCGSAYCEVEFEIKGEKYLSSWSQRRARDKSDGKLQSPKMEISLLKDRKILHSGTREVSSFIEELSGLDFSRFLKSMMLAQGSFDAFLKAGEKDRSQLLEKITGTKIYAKISTAIFEKHKSGNEDLKLTRDLIDNIDILDDDSLELKENSLYDNKREKLELDKSLEKLNIAIDWTRTFNILKEEKERYSKELIVLENKKSEQKDNFIKLDKAKRALNIIPVYSQMENINLQLNKDNNKSMSLIDNIDNLEDDKVKIGTKYNFISTEYKREKILFQIESQKIKDAKEIEIKINELQRSIDEMSKTIDNKNLKKVDLEQILENIIKESIDIEKDIDIKSKYISDNIKDKDLIESLSLIEDNLNNYKDKYKLLKSNEKELNISIKSFDNILDKKDKKELEVDELSKVFNKSKNKYQKIIDELKDNDIQEPKLRDELLSLETILVNHKRLKVLNDKLKENKEEKKSLSKDIKNKKIIVSTLRENREQSLLIKKYEDDRKRLLDGETCFLCGSKKHPFVKDKNKIPQDKSSDKLIEQESKLKELEDNFTKVILTLDNLNQEIISLDVSVDKKDLKNKIKFISKELSNIIELNKKRDIRLLKRDEANNNLQNQKEELNILIQKFIEEKETLNQLEENISRNREDVKRLGDNLSLKFIENDLVFESISADTNLDKLKNRKDNFIDNKNSLDSISEIYQEIEIKIGQRNSELKSLKNELDTQNISLSEKKNRIDRFIIEKSSILDIEDLEEYEDKVNQDYADIEKVERDINNDLKEVYLKHKEIKKQLLDIKKDIEINSDKLDLILLELDKSLGENYFNDVDDFEESRLEKEDIDKLEDTYSSIINSLSHIKTLNDDINNKFEIHTKESTINLDLQILEDNYANEKNIADEVQLSIGKIEQELDIDNKNRAKHEGRIADLAEKHNAFKVCEKMQELIGSSNGAKFAKFAQGITLDQLIELANNHLAVLNQRYILVRSEGDRDLLEISIIDTFQADSIRSVSTLSGGESFIISLSLALGLSELASQKISIDSLFLDEGFGTLDEKNLDMALNALNRLQSQGKMIGVISHIEALKERIPTQIKVISNGDGTSRILY